MNEKTPTPILPPPAPAGPPQIPVTPKLIAGIFGMFLGAMLGGLNNRLGVLGLDDLRGLFGFGYDEATWITSLYAAGELVIMPFVAWLVSVFSLKRLEIFMLLAALILALILPAVSNLPLLAALRFVQALACGALMFMFMIALFMLLPAHLRMYGFGFYAMVATFAPNFGVWLCGLWTDALHDWRLLYWHSFLLGLPALALVRFGLPDMTGKPERLRSVNWRAALFVIPGCLMLALALSQGQRLDWFNSRLIAWALLCGPALLALYALGEWHHPDPFLQLRVFTCHRNVWMALIILLNVLVIALAGTMLPVSWLGRIWGFRPMQSAPAALVMALPQFLIGPAVAWILYRRSLDARAVYIGGLLLLVLGCALGSRIDTQWAAPRFFLCQGVIALGLPTTIIATIFMTSNNIRPMLGPALGGAINTLRCIGTLAGTALVGRYLQSREHVHFEWLRDKAGLLRDAPSDFASLLGDQAFAGAVADTYQLLGLWAAALVPIVLAMRYTPPPQAPKTPSPPR